MHICRFLVSKVYVFHTLVPTFVPEFTSFDISVSLQGLTLDIEKGNLLRLGKEGIILAASHGTRKMNDIEIERAYGRGRKRHIAGDYATHLQVKDGLSVGLLVMTVVGAPKRDTQPVRKARMVVSVVKSCH